MSNPPVMDVERLVAMANQIGDFFAPYPPAQRTEGIRNHLRHYWDLRMREALLEHLDAADGAGLEESVATAARLLRDESRAGAKAYAGPPRVA
jgi:formate dehydrogenase subunit delta